MPELPEVETTRRGIAPLVSGHRVVQIVVRDGRLRWPVAADIDAHLRGQCLLDVDRRGKYLLFRFADGCLIVHLGMSGSLRVLDAATPPNPHDHIDLVFDHGQALRLRDPRRFGAVIWSADAASHALLRDLGPEPLGPAFTADYLATRARGRRRAIKDFLMDAHTVVGVGNIYASEALFAAGIRPTRAAGRLTRREWTRVVEAIRTTLNEAIEAGGTTLRDFSQADGRPGYFRHALKVYARAGLPCLTCGRIIAARTIGQRASFYCPGCQH